MAMLTKTLPQEENERQPTHIKTTIVILIYLNCNTVRYATAIAKLYFLIPEATIFS